MKKPQLLRGSNYFSYVSLIVVLCSLLLFACQNPSVSQGVPWPISGGKGSVTLVVDGASARTISPHPDNVTIVAYTITFLAPGTNTAPETFDRTAANLSDPFYLVPGIYDIQVTAYIDAPRTKAAAQGEIKGIEVFEGINVTRNVSLNLIVTPYNKGTFTWEIKVPSGLASASMKITPVNTVTGTPEIPLSFTGPSPFTGSLSLNTGYYQITFELTKTGTQKIIFREFLHVFDNLESFFSKEFTNDHFNNIQYTVTFVFDNGVTSNLTQDRLHGEKATNHTPAVSKPIPAGLYAGTPPEHCTFAGWYNGNTRWNFNDPVTDSMTLTAHWTADRLVGSVVPNDIIAVVNYVYTKTDPYTLLLGEDVNFPSLFNLSNANLTITGINAVTIDNPSIFYVTSAALTIGKNITFSGSGVLWVRINASLTLSDNAVINKIYLNAENTGNSSITIESGWTGSVASLNLYGADTNTTIDNVIGFWYNKTQPVTVLKGGGLSAATIAQFTLGNFYSSMSSSFKPIAEANPPDAPGGYVISTDEIDIGKLIALHPAAKIGEKEYLTLYEAIADAANGFASSPTEIIILRDITTPERRMADSTGYVIPENKNIKLTVESGKSHTITASAGNFTLFSITNTGSSLTLGPTSGGGTLTLSGGKAAAESDRRGVYVNGSGRTFTMNDGVTITGFNKSTTNTSGVYVGSDSLFTMNGGEISGNTSLSFGGGVYVRPNGTFTMNDGKIKDNVLNNGSDSGSGGGVYTYGTFTMYGGEISGNNVSYCGGGVYVGNDGDFTMNSGKISNNTASASGGGVAISGTFTMNGGEISNNTASTNGGGVLVGFNNSTNSTFTMIDGEISGNKANYGSGVFLSGGGTGITFTMSDGEISGNTANSNGGGVYVSAGSEFTMNAGSVLQNNRATNGGGVYISTTDAKFTMSGGEISGNRASTRGGGVYISSGTFTMNGGNIYGADALTGFTPNTASGTAPNGAAVYRDSGTAAYDGAYAGKGYGSGTSGNDITTTNNTLPPAPSAAITITFAQITDAAPNITGPTLSRTGTGGNQKNATLTLGSGYTDVSWEITGTGFTGQPGITGTGDSFKLDATDSRYNKIGDHYLTLTVHIGGVPYNKIIIFKIVE